jgi:hypothetical protein
MLLAGYMATALASLKAFLDAKRENKRTTKSQLVNLPF